MPPALEGRVLTTEWEFHSGNSQSGRSYDFRYIDPTRRSDFGMFRPTLIALVFVGLAGCSFFFLIFYFILFCFGRLLFCFVILVCFCREDVFRLVFLWYRQLQTSWCTRKEIMVFQKRVFLLLVFKSNSYFGHL